MEEVDRFDAVFGSVAQESFTPAADGDSFPYTASLPSIPKSDEKYASSLCSFTAILPLPPPAGTY